MKITAIGLLVVGMFARYGWQWAPEWAQADVWNADRAFYIMVLLGAIAAGYWRYKRLVLVCVYLAVLEAFTAGCSMLWLQQQWIVLPGQDQCDTRFRIPLSLMGLFLGLVILVSIRSGRRGKDPKH